MHVPRPLASAHFLLGASTLLWAGHWIVARGVREEFSATTLAFWRWAVATLVLLAIAGQGLYRKRGQLRGSWLHLAFFGITGTGIYSILAYRGIQATSATNALLLQAITPALIPVFAWLIFRERIRAHAVIGVAVSFLGILAIVTRMDPLVLATLSFDHGDLWILGSVALWALYTACLRLRPAGLTQLEFLLAIALVGLVPMTPFYLAEIASGTGGLRLRPDVIFAVFYVAVVLSVINYAIWGIGVKAIGSTATGIYLNMVPPVGIIMAVLILGETPRAYHALGFLLTLAGVWLASRRPAR